MKHFIEVSSNSTKRFINAHHIFEVAKESKGTVINILLSGNEYQEKPYHRIFVDEDYETVKKLITDALKE
jgi:hypothetical protein